MTWSSVSKLCSIRRLRLYRLVYLKTRGINPKTHPVVGELVCRDLVKCQIHLLSLYSQDRIKQYFDKIKNTEDPEKSAFIMSVEPWVLLTASCP